MSLINPAILLDPPCEPGCPRKRRRLDNLTPEERALRRKLKNRVAAQTARDRKKARMTELEESLAAYEEENKKLLRENKELQKRASDLAAENNELKARLGLTPPSSPESSSDDVSSQLSSVTAAMPSPPRSPSQEESRVVIKQEKESPEYAAGTISDSFSFSPHDYCATESTQSDELFSFLEDFKPGNPDEFITIKEEPEDVLNVCSGGKRETKVKEGVEGYQGLSEGVGKTPKCLESTSEFMTSNELDKAIETYAAEPSMNENMWWEESFPDLFPALVDV